MTDTTAVLLAGGRSQRMGRDKPTLLLDGETLVARHVRQAMLAGINRFVVVANDDNEPRISDLLADARRNADVTVTRQRAPDAEGAIVTGLEHADGATTVIISCTNDTVDDDTYSRLLALRKGPSGGLVFVAARVTWPFVGGRLIEGDQPGTVNRIDERPPGGCPPGAAINVMIHRITSPGLRHQVLQRLREGDKYEPCLNSLIATGTPAAAIQVRRWVGIKTAEDLQELRSIFGKDRTSVADATS